MLYTSQELRYYPRTILCMQKIGQILREWWTCDKDKSALLTLLYSIFNKNEWGQQWSSIIYLYLVGKTPDLTISNENFPVKSGALLINCQGALSWDTLLWNTYDYPRLFNGDGLEAVAQVGVSYI